MIFLMKKTHKQKHLSWKLLPILTGAILLATSTAYAQDQSPASQSQPHPKSSPEVTGQQPHAAEMANQKEIQQKIMEWRGLQEQQREIQKETIENNPDLKKQEQALKTLLEETLDKNLAAQDVDMDADLKNLQKKINEANVTAEEKAKLEAEFRENVQKYKQARADTLNTPEVREKIETLSNGIQEKNPEAEKIGKKIEKLEQELREAFAQSPQSTQQ